MVWWQRLFFCVLLGLANFVGVLVWVVVAITYDPSPANYATFVIGAILGAYFLVLIAHRWVKLCRQTCSVVATTVAVLLGDASFVIASSVFNTWFRAHGLNNLGGVIIGLLPTIGLIALSTFWRASPRTRVGLTLTAVVAWVTFSTLLGFHLWEFPDGEYMASSTLRFTANWFLASTLPFLIALLIACRRDGGGSLRPA